MRSAKGVFLRGWLGVFCEGFGYLYPSFISHPSACVCVCVCVCPSLRQPAGHIPAGHAPLGEAHLRDVRREDAGGELHRLHLPAVWVSGPTYVSVFLSICVNVCVVVCIGVCVCAFKEN